MVNEINAQSDIKKRKKYKSYKWLKDVVFNNQEEALRHIQKENQWSYYFTNYPTDGKKVYYRCNKVKYRSGQCDARICLFYDAANDDIVLFRSDEKHTHENIPAVSRISTEIKAEINKLIELRLKTKGILEALYRQGVEQVPTMSQLRNHLVKYRKEKYGSSTISLGQLEQWCFNCSVIPENDDEGFVSSYEVLYNDEHDDEAIDNDTSDYDENEGKFRIFITTKRLLKLASKATKIHADATYKLIWEGFPVIIVVTSDLDRHFHPFSMAVCSNGKSQDFKFIFESLKKGVEKFTKEQFNPSILISDYSNAIRNAFETVFGNSLMIMCWAHMRRNVVSKVQSLVDTKYQTSIIDDLDTLQLSQNEIIFKKASTLFLNKWKIKKQTEFVEYFEEEWLKSHNTWYEGIKYFVPSTNNCLESFNKVIKDEDTYRERMVLSRFRIIVLETVTKWSSQYKNNLKQYIETPTITLDVWTKAYQWAKSDKNVISMDCGNTIDYFIPAADDLKISRDAIDIINKMRWKTFDQFKRHAFNIWCLKMQKDPSNWVKGICNCPAFFKSYICKYMVGISVRLRFCKPPPAAKDIPIGEKRKRGRPKKATKALLVD